MDKELIQQTAFKQDDTLYDKKIEPVPKPDPQIGINLDNELLYSIIGSAEDNTLDVNKLNSFTAVSRSRNELYDTLDIMAQDTTLASVLETYAEDATERNDDGNIVWCESDDANVSKYVSFLLDSLCVNKNVFRWTYSLCKYGDLYLRLYRESEVEDKFFNKSKSTTKDKSTLNEDVNIIAYDSRDRYVHYLEAAPNPAQVFELTRFGKTAGYITTNVKPVVDSASSSGLDTVDMYNMSRYRFNSNSSDVNLYPATEWVHGCLESDSSRSPEQVELFNDTTEENNSSIYNVKRGESLLYDSYKTWRELMLLENSVLLNRVTQSSIVRIIGVEVGDMPKENVQPHLMNIKHLIEQKAAIDVGNSLNEYTNPGPIVNNIYIPTRNNQGVLSTQQIGGDVNVGELVDLDYYEDKLFGGLRVPKQYFGRTDDSAGFSGGTSLSIISSRYAKMIKRIQNVVIQMITDAINLILIDTGNANYINKFRLKMLAPTTQEEIDRRDNVTSKIALINDIMGALADVDDPLTRLRILKSLISDSVTNSEVVSILQDYIDSLETEVESGADAPQDIPSTDSLDDVDLFSETDDLGMDTNYDFDAEVPAEESTYTSDDSTLPSPDDLGVGDFSDSTNPEFA